jgi:hypothetical protein
VDPGPVLDQEKAIPKATRQTGSSQGQWSTEIPCVSRVPVREKSSFHIFPQINPLSNPHFQPCCDGYFC